MGHRVLALATLLACVVGSATSAEPVPAADAPSAAAAAASPATAAAEPELPPARAYGERSLERVEYGRYLTLAGGCAACHSREGGQPFDGGLAIDTPFGTLYTPNITPTEGYGIGEFSDEDFLRALQHGIRPDGKPYYPTLPYPAYTRVRDDDLLAIKDYLFSLEPSRHLPPQTELRWPFDTRDPLFGWQALYLKPGRLKPDPDKTDAYNRGAYLVEGLGRCRTCHTPRKLAGAAQDKDALSDAYLDGWSAPGLAGDLAEGLGDRTEAQIVALLRSGEVPEPAAEGTAPEPMAAAAHRGLARLATADLKAMAVYLKDMPPQAEPSHTPELPQQLTAATYRLGHRLYAGYCASCHQSHGQGLPPYFPPLAGNDAVTGDDPEAVLKTLLLGAPADPAEAYSPHVVMPSFGSIFTDAQIAALASYIRASWGNDAASVDSEAVAATRGMP